MFISGDVMDFSKLSSDELIKAVELTKKPTALEVALKNELITLKKLLAKKVDVFNKIITLAEDEVYDE